MIALDASVLVADEVPDVLVGLDQEQRAAADEVLAGWQRRNGISPEAEEAYYESKSATARTAATPAE